MNILSSNGRTLINYDNVTALRMFQKTDDSNKWAIISVYQNGSYDVITSFGTEYECQNVFDKLCGRIVKCWKHDIIDLGDL